MQKRLLSIALAVLLCLSAFPLSAFAANIPETVTATYNISTKIVNYTDSTTDYIPGAAYYIRLIDNTGLVHRLSTTATASGDIDASVMLTELQVKTYTVYVDDAIGQTVAQGTLVISAVTNYTLSVTAGPNGAVGGTASGTYTASTAISITATANSGYRFDSWTVTGVTPSSVATSPLTFAMPANAVTVRANFVLDSSTVTPSRPGGGGGGGGGGEISNTVVITSQPNGKVTASPVYPITGNRVTLTVTPNTGYEMDTLTITDGNGNLVSYIDNGNGTFTYTQPAGVVKVTATFKQISATNPPSWASFTDIRGHWAYAYIQAVVERGLFSGTSATTFSPDTSMTRAMFATVLSRLDGADTSIYTGSRFGDVPSGTWFTGGVEWAAANGIVSGIGNNLFDPDSSITREQMAVMLFRYLRYKGYDLPMQGSSKSFSDDAQISSWAREAVDYMQRAGIINGKPDNIFDPKGVATRAEVATVFARFVEALKQ